ncbi:hypothetical protein [Rickettsia asembonensis]|uniref:hypothetical protein n=1 Tax=Rickettsia asembonensis TaxID=1068590 RepID=UPI0005979FB6|nr:hypothetical protein [Rickettsia asembonensis]
MAIISIFNKLQNLIPHNISSKPASYLANDEFNYRSNEKLKIWGYKDTLGISQIKYTDIMNELDGSEKVTNTPESKGFFSTFSSSLKTVYDFGVKSFNIIKNTSSILSSKVAETFNFVSNKVFSYLNNNAEETFNLLDQLETLSDNELVEEILNTPENELDEVFKKMTYEKLAELINNISDEQAQKLVNYIMPWHFEKVIDLITQDKLDKLFNENPNNLSLEELTEQELKKLSNEDISDEWLKNIIILAGEEKFAEKLDIISNENLEKIINNISNDKLVTIINNVSDENLERIVNINLQKILPLLPFKKITQIPTLMDDKEIVEQFEKQQLLEEIINTPDSELDKIKITYEKLAKLINNTSDEDLERIVDSHSLSGSLVQEIITLIYNKKCAKQESGEVSDSDSGFSDSEDEIEVSDNQVGFSNSDFTTKLSGNNFGFFDYESDNVVYV